MLGIRPGHRRQTVPFIVAILVTVISMLESSHRRSPLNIASVGLIFIPVFTVLWLTFFTHFWRKIQLLGETKFREEAKLTFLTPAPFLWSQIKYSVAALLLPFLVAAPLLLLRLRAYFDTVSYINYVDSGLWALKMQRPPYPSKEDLLRELERSLNFNVWFGEHHRYEWSGLLLAFLLGLSVLMILLTGFLSCLARRMRKPGMSRYFGLPPIIWCAGSISVPLLLSLDATYKDAGYRAMVWYFSSQGLDFNVRIDSGDTLLHWAALLCAVCLVQMASSWYSACTRCYDIE